MTNQGDFHKPEGKFPWPSQARVLHSTFIILFLAGSASKFQSHLLAQETRAGYGLTASGQSPDEALVESLIQEGLPTFAMKVCESRLPLHALDSDAHAKWRMLALHAQTAVALQDLDISEGSAAIATIDRSLEALSADAKGTPREAWVQWKKLWCRWYVLQRLLAAYLAVPSREALRDAIIVSIRGVLDDAEQLELELRSTQPANGADIPTSQRLDLRGSLDLLKADLLYQRSQCYPRASDDRIAAASEMLSSLELALSKLPGDWTRRPALSIAKAKAQVQLEQYDAALASLQSLWKQLQEAQSTSPETKQYLRTIAAVGVRAARELERWDDVDAWMARGGGANATPELALESFACEIKRGGGDVAERALQIKRDIGTRFGPYWEQRAEAILVSSGGLGLESNRSIKPTGSASLEVLRIEVRQLLAAKRWNEAIQKLEQAALAAKRESADSEAFAFAMQRAAILESNGQREIAANAFFQAATEHPMQPKAPAAALMSAWLIRREASASSPSTLDSATLYLDRLQEISQRWPASDAAAQAIDWLERDTLARDNVAAVLDVWTSRVASPQHLTSGLARFAFITTLLQDDWIEPSPFQEPSVRDALVRLQEELIEQTTEIDRDRFAQSLPLLAQERRWSVPVLSGDASTPYGMAAVLVSGPVSALQEPNAIRTLLMPWKDDPLGRIGWLWTSCELRSASLLSRSRPPSNDELRSIALLNQQLREETESVNRYPLGPVIAARIMRSIRFHEILTGTGESDPMQLLASLEQERDANKKSAWWLYRSARVLQMDSEKRKDSIPWFRQMANGFPTGSEPWLEARARTVQTLRWLGDSTAADQLRELVLATYPASAPLWRPRLDAK